MQNGNERKKKGEKEGKRIERMQKEGKDENLLLSITRITPRIPSIDQVNPKFFFNNISARL